MNKIIHILGLTIFLIGTSLQLQAQGTSKVPHPVLSRYLNLGSSVTIDNVEYTPLYLEFKKGVIFKPEKTKFYTKKLNGKKTPVKCDTLSAIPIDDLTKIDLIQIGEGYTHKLWVRKDIKDDGESTLIWNLPKKSVTIGVYNVAKFRARIPIVPK